MPPVTVALKSYLVDRLQAVPKLASLSYKLSSIKMFSKQMPLCMMCFLDKKSKRSTNYNPKY